MLDLVPALTGLIINCSSISMTIALSLGLNLDFLHLVALQP